MSDNKPDSLPSRCGVIALMGAPNAGKSTLTNVLVGAKISIVTPKVQTTRGRITAIGLRGLAQLIFVDTPGIFRDPKRRLEKAMLHAAWTGAEEADVRLLLVDASRGRDSDTNAIVEGIRHAGLKAVLVLNKIDLVRRDSLLGLAQSLNDEGIFTDTYMVSALNGDGVDDLLDGLAAAAAEGPWLYPEDQLAVVPQRLLAAEMTREQIFLQLHDELPYSITVETESWKQQKDGSLRISQVIYVQRDSQKSIVLGQGGRQVRKIGERARAAMAENFGCTVHLFLFVKVREKWPDDPARYREMGLEFPKERS